MLTKIQVGEKSVFPEKQEFLIYPGHLFLAFIIKYYCNILIFKVANWTVEIFLFA